MADIRPRTPTEMERFTIKTRDVPPPGLELWEIQRMPFLSLEWRARIIPRVGDNLELMDEGGSQGVTVAEVSFELDGSVEVYVGPFDGWDPGSVTKLFAASERFLRGVELEERFEAQVRHDGIAVQDEICVPLGHISRNGNR